MRNRRAILFFLAWSLLFAFAIFALWAFRRPVPAIPRETLSDLDAQSVYKVEIERSGAGGKPERIVISRSAGRWRIESPIDAEADEETAKRLIDSVVFAEPQDALSERDMTTLRRTMHDFGLDQPRFSVTLHADGRRASFQFGRKTAIGEEIYVRQIGVDAVFTVPKQATRELGLPLGAFRRRNLFSFLAEDICGIGLKNANEPFSKIAKQDGAWRLSEPVDAPADRKVADALIRAVCAARIMSYAAVGEGIGTGIGDDEGGYVLSLRNSRGMIEKAVIGTAAGSNVVWALSPEGAAVRIDASLLAECQKCQKTIEDTRVFPVEAEKVTSISISDGFPAYMLARKDMSDPWKMLSPVNAPADAQNVEGLLSRLLAIRGVDILPDATNAVKTFSVSVGTAATNFPGRNVAQRLLLKGARLVDLRDRLLIRHPAGKVRRIQVSTSAGAQWNLQLPAATAQVEKPHELFGLIDKGVEAESIEAISPSKEDVRRCGLDKPSYTVMFELDDEKSAMVTLQIGGAAEGGGRYASIGGADTVFILSAATVSAITKPAE